MSEDTDYEGIKSIYIDYRDFDKELSEEIEDIKDEINLLEEKVEDINEEIGQLNRRVKALEGRAGGKKSVGDRETESSELEETFNYDEIIL